MSQREDLDLDENLLELDPPSALDLPSAVDDLLISKDSWFELDDREFIRQHQLFLW